MAKHIEIVPDKESLVSKALEIVTKKIKQALQTQSQFTISLAGGSTPKPLYELMAKESLPWEKIKVFWGDERYVGVDHPQSNQKMVREAWLNGVKFPENKIYPIPTDGGNPNLDAQKYETELLNCFELSPGEIPVFYLILLGMGDDGHTASLFPNTEALKVTDHLITVGNKDGEPRITFTVPLINAARCIIFMVAGANKQNALKQIFAGEADSMLYPARLIQPQGELWWLLDKDAGAILEEEN